MADNKKTTTTLYHHTSREGAIMIAKSGCIKASINTKTDAKYGPGTYMTSKGPERTESEIARNNYDGAAKQGMEAGKTKVTIAVDVKDAVRAPTDRDIFVVKGDVPLADKNPTFYIRDKDGKAHKLKKSGGDTQGAKGDNDGKATRPRSRRDSRSAKRGDDGKATRPRSRRDSRSANRGDDSKATRPRSRRDSRSAKRGDDGKATRPRSGHDSGSAKGAKDGKSNK